MPAIQPGGLPTGERAVAAATWPWGTRDAEAAALPLMMRAASVDPDYAPAPPRLDERPRVLVVEDDPGVAQMLDDLLSDAGYCVLLADDGQAGFAQAVREQPSVVLSDFMLPGMDGGQLIGKLRMDPRTRAIPVVLMSSSHYAPRRLPGVPFLQKPFNVDDVLALLARALRETTPLTRYGEG
jgi:CheY-like chemotaxis protein